MRLLLLLLLALPAFSTCTLRSGTSNIYDCPDTGNPVTNGEDLLTFLEVPGNYSCGSTIVLAAGAEYHTRVVSNFSYGFRIPPQTGCTPGNPTQIISSKLPEIPSLKMLVGTTWEAHRSWIGTQFPKFAKLVCRGPSQDNPSCVVRLFGPAATSFGPANDWAFRGLIFTTNSETTGAVIGTGWTVDPSETRLITEAPRKIEFDRCIWTSHQEIDNGAVDSATTQAPFFRSMNIGIQMEGREYYIHDSAFLGFTVFDPSITANGNITAATQANPSVVTSTGITTTLGISYHASCSGGLTQTCYDNAGGTLVVIEGATGSWATLNGIKGVVAINGSSDTVQVWDANAFSWLDTSSYDGTGKGSLTGTVNMRKAVPTNPTYALFSGQGCVDCRIEDNVIDGGQMVLFMGGTNRQFVKPLGYSTVQSGSTSTSINLTSTAGIALEHLISVYAPGKSTYCTVSSWGCWGGGVRVGKVTAINSTTNVTVAPWGPDGIDVAPTTGQVARWNGWQIENLIVKRNLIRRSPSVMYTGKGFAEFKTCLNCLYTANRHECTSAGNWFNTNRSQGGRDPWNTMDGMKITDNIQGCPTTTGGAGASYHLLFGQGQDNEHTTKNSRDVIFAHNISIDVRKRGGSTNGMWAVFSGQGGGIFHNSAFIRTSPTQDAHYGFSSAGTCPSDDGTGYYTAHQTDIGLVDNIGFYGDTINTNECALTSARRGRMLGNLWHASGSASTSAITSAWPSNNAVASIAGELNGSCLYASFTDCRLANASTYRGAATDGADPGADVYRVQDRINGWSEQAGLMVTGHNGQDSMRLSDRWQVGSTKVAITFPLFNSTVASGCTVKLYTNPHRATLHADTDTGGEQACNRASSPAVAGKAAFVFGGSAALTANTTYYWEITDGTRVMVGSFKTKPTGAATTITFQYGSSRAGEYSANADMSSPTSISSSTTHSVPVNQGAVVYYRTSGGNIQTLINP